MFLKTVGSMNLLFGRLHPNMCYLLHVMSCFVFDFGDS